MIASRGRVGGGGLKRWLVPLRTRSDLQASKNWQARTEAGNDTYASTSPYDVSRRWACLGASLASQLQRARTRPTVQLRSNYEALESRVGAAASC